MEKTASIMRNVWRVLALGAGATGLLALPLLSELRLKRAEQPLTDAWQRLPIEPRRDTLLGISFRPPQIDALGLDARASLSTLLAYPFQLIRLGAYWNRIEQEPGTFATDELDWQINAAERAGKRIILCLGPLKTFGYPEFFAPAHRLRQPFPERTLIRPSAYRELLTAACEFIARLVECYRQREAVIAWQLEHEAVDPLGMEHTWRLDTSFVEQELATLRKADPTRPIMLNGFLPTSLLVRLSQWWQTRDQGDSLALAQRLADIVGVDYYPRHALRSLGPRALYLDGSRSPWLQWRKRQLFARARTQRKKLMVAEGQAEPWETVTMPPDPIERSMYSCSPEQLIVNYNAWMRLSRQEMPLYAYLFWGAEYWLLRERSGDARYLRAFARILERA